MGWKCCKNNGEVKSHVVRTASFGEGWQSGQGTEEVGVATERRRVGSTVRQSYAANAVFGRLPLPH